jgi:pimeloyl-ACP methyl ester carboxylesterase
MGVRILPWVSEIPLPGSPDRRVLLFSGFGSGPETLRELGEALRTRLGSTVLLAALARHGGDERAFRGSRSWHYVTEAERRFLSYWAETQSPVVLGGYSTGALVGLLIAAKHPDKVCGLVLVSPALRLSQTEKQLVGYTVTSTYYLALPVALVGTVLALSWHGRRRNWARTRTLLRTAGSTALFAAAAAGLRALTVPLAIGATVTREGEEVLPPHFTRASLLAGATIAPLQLVARWRLQQLSMPVCVVFGELDTVVDVRYGTLRAAKHRSSELHVVPGAAHRVAGHEECQAIVCEFVERLFGRP